MVRATCKQWRKNTPYKEAGKIVLGDEMAYKAHAERMFGISSRATLVLVAPERTNLGFTNHQNLIRLADAFELAIDPKTGVLRTKLPAMIQKKRAKKQASDLIISQKNEQMTKRYNANKHLVHSVLDAEGIPTNGPHMIHLPSLYGDCSNFMDFIPNVRKSLYINTFHEYEMGVYIREFKKANGHKVGATEYANAKMNDLLKDIDFSMPYIMIEKPKQASSKRTRITYEDN
jgi:hypothetical protein